MKKILYLALFAGFIYTQCNTYYADIDGDGDGAKSVWCSYTDLPHATGGNWEDAGWETNGCGTVGWNGDTPAGHLTYGPYISTDPGTTHVTWNMLANGDVDNDGTQIATIDIYDSTSGDLLAWQNINVNDFNGSMVWQDFSLSYYSSPDHVYEFRTWYTSQGGHLVLRYITHINEDADVQGAYETSELCEGDDTSGWSLNDDDLMSLCAENSNDECWDCAGEWGGSATTDNCDTCDSDPSNDCTQDCGGDWGGEVVVDDCGLCGGDGSTCACTPNGDANEDVSITVTDLVLIINNILNDTISDELICSSDVNGDGSVDVVDIVAIIELIIN